MTRTRFVPEQEKPERRYGRDDADFKTEGFAPESKDPEVEWEFLSVENFVEDKLDSDATTYTGGELQRLAQTTNTPYPLVKDQLMAYGLTLAAPKAERTFRTFGDNPHNRWLTDDAKRMSGGGGGGAIMGMVDRVG